MAQSTPCGDPSCSAGQFTDESTCNGSGACITPSAVPCTGGLICANAATCKASCNANSDCVGTGSYCQNPGQNGVCVGQGGSGAICTANFQCTSNLCGTSGFGNHCCTSTCSATVAACGATDCDSSGSCAYPGTTVAPASLQTPGDCQKIVCNNSGGTTSVDDVTDLPTPYSVCLINPSCQGIPATPHFDPAPTGTNCAADNQFPNHVCGDTNDSLVAGTCVQCNTSTDCLAINPAGTLTCDTVTHVCE